MEYADGGDLSQLLGRHRDAGTWLSEEEALGYFVQIALGLKHIHDKSIVHRDIKSQNVFLTKDGIVKLGDFGVAKTLAGTADMAKTQIGTPYYLSPEIVAGEQYNRKTDVRAAGRCCGMPLLWGDTPASPPPLRRSGVWASFCTRCWR